MRHEAESHGHYDGAATMKRESTPTTAEERREWRGQWTYAGYAQGVPFRLLEDVEELKEALQEAQAQSDERHDMLSAERRANDQMRAHVLRVEAERDEARRERDACRNLVARMNGDGGQHQQEAGMECAANDAERVFVEALHSLDKLQTEKEALRDDLARLRVREGQLREALVKYGTHVMGCPEHFTSDDYREGCTCGWDTALSSPSDAPDVLGAIRVVARFSDAGRQVVQDALATLRAAGVIE